jgi:hypothetical protein
MASSDEVKQSITNWCSSDDDLEITADRFQPGTDFAFGMRAGTLSLSPVELLVLKADGEDRVTIRRSLTLSGDNVAAVNKLISSRPGLVTASVDRSGLDTAVVAQTYVYLDGLSKHTFVQAVAELARTGTLIDELGTEVPEADEGTVLADQPDVDTSGSSTTDDGTVIDTVATPAGTSSFSPAPADTGAQTATPQPAPVATPVPTPLPQPSFSPQPAPQPVQAQPAQAQPVQAQPAYTPQPQPYQAQPVQPQPTPQQIPNWVPSHSVPAQGLRAWSAPDPSGPVVANLAPGLPIQVAEVRGAWARVICSNGWTGWIDGRIIGVAA